MGKQPDETIEEDGKEKEIELETEASTKESLTNLDDDTTQEEDSDEINIEEEDGNEKETKLETETSTEESLPNLDNDSEQEVDSAERLSR